MTWFVQHSRRIYWKLQFSRDSSSRLLRALRDFHACSVFVYSLNTTWGSWLETACFGVWTCIEAVLVGLGQLSVFRSTAPYVSIIHCVASVFNHFIIPLLAWLFFESKCEYDFFFFNYYYSCLEQLFLLFWSWSSFLSTFATNEMIGDIPPFFLSLPLEQCLIFSYPQTHLRTS